MSFTHSSRQSDQSDRKDRPFGCNISSDKAKYLLEKSAKEQSRSCYLNISEERSALSQQNMYTIVSGVRRIDDKSPKSASIMKAVVAFNYGLDGFHSSLGILEIITLCR